MKLNRYILIVFAICAMSLGHGLAGGTRDYEKIPYAPGEELKFVIKFGFIKGGVAKLSIKEKKLDDNRAYHIVADTRSVGILDQLYKVRDVYESYIDPQTGLPYKAVRDIREGSYEVYNELTFDHDSNIVISDKTGRHEVPDNMLDILSAFYYARRFHFNDDLKKGDEISLKAFFDDKIFPLDIRYVGREKVKTSLGTFKCLKFIPLVQTGRVFKTREDMQIWVTDDGNYLPIRIKFDLKIGSLKFDLENYSNLKFDISSKVD